MRTHTHAHSRARPPTAHSPTGPAAAAPVRTPTAVRQILGHTQIQRKLQVSPVDDRFEREADRISDETVRAPALSELSDANAAALRENTLPRRAPDHSNPSAAPAVVQEVLRSPGQPLDPATRAYFEPHFGHDFSGVRVHTDSKGAESARAVDASAYTVGSHIVFGAGPTGVGHEQGSAHISARISARHSAGTRGPFTPSSARRHVGAGA